MFCDRSLLLPCLLSCLFFYVVLPKRKKVPQGFILISFPSLDTILPRSLIYSHNSHLYEDNSEICISSLHG